jgi:hypothetical protein
MARKVKSALYTVGPVQARGNRYLVRWQEDGRTRERSNTDEAAATKMADEVADRLASGAQDYGYATIADVCAAHLASPAVQRNKPNTVAQRRSLIHCHVVPFIGKIKVSNIRASNFAGVGGQVHSVGYPESTVGAVMIAAGGNWATGQLGNWATKRGIFPPSALLIEGCVPPVEAAARTIKQKITQGEGH